MIGIILYIGNYFIDFLLFLRAFAGVILLKLRLNRQLELVYDYVIDLIQQIVDQLSKPIPYAAIGACQIQYKALQHLIDVDGFDEQLHFCAQQIFDQKSIFQNHKWTF